MRKVKVFSLQEPWASYLLNILPGSNPPVAIKEDETRSYEISYRGTLYIQASSTWSKRQKEIVREEPHSQFRHLYWREGEKKPFTLGHIIGRVDLLQIKTTNEWLDQYKAEDLEPGGKAYLNFMFGDYGPMRFAWRMGCPIKFQEKDFFFVKGSQLPFNVDLPDHYFTEPELIKPFYNGSQQ